MQLRVKQGVHRIPVSADIGREWAAYNPLFAFMEEHALKTNQPKMYHAHGKHVVVVASHRAEEFFLHLAAQGIEARVNLMDGQAQLELAEDVNVDAVRAVLNKWR
jgi:hypothetical protein